MTRLETIASIQTILGVKPDSAWGPRSQAAFDALIHPDSAPTNPDVHSVKASSFADPADVASFRRCKASGKTDEECFEVGDNGVGEWGDDTSEGSGPSCALPPEDWIPFGPTAHNRKILVKANGREVVCLLKDTMPRRANIHNGAGIDLNPDACESLGLRPPVMISATWKAV